MKIKGKDMKLTPRPPQHLVFFQLFKEEKVKIIKQQFLLAQCFLIECFFFFTLIITALMIKWIRLWIQVFQPL